MLIPGEKEIMCWIVMLLRLQKDLRNEILERGVHLTHHRHLQPQDSHHPLRNIDSFMVFHYKFMLEYSDCECTKGFMNHNINIIARRYLYTA